MKTLLVMRHAKSSWKEGDLPDHDRPLNKRGKRDAPRMGRLVREEDLVPDLVISSTALRARSTAEAMGEESGYEDEILISRELYGAGPERILEVLSGLPDRYERVLLVGHNPGLEELVETLTDEVETLPTAALAQIALSIENWHELLDRNLPGKLVNLWRPRDLA